MAGDTQVNDVAQRIQRHANTMVSLRFEIGQSIDKNQSEQIDWNNLQNTNPDVLVDPTETDPSKQELKELPGISPAEISNALGSFDSFENEHYAVHGVNYAKLANA